jgi:hypothetical protein
MEHVQNLMEKRNPSPSRFEKGFFFALKVKETSSFPLALQSCFGFPSPHVTPTRDNERGKDRERALTPVPYDEDNYHPSTHSGLCADAYGGHSISVLTCALFLATQDLPCFASQAKDTFTTSSQEAYVDRVVCKELLTTQVTCDDDQGHE